MKKIISLSFVIAMLLCILAGCGSKESSVVGTWYSDQDDESVLMLKKDKTYTDGSWLTSGDFSIEADTVVMAGALDGTTILQIEKENNKTILRYYGSDGSILRTFYNSSDQAQAARDARKEAERIAAEEQAAAELKTLKDGIVGYWYRENIPPIAFTQDGLYIEYTVDGLQEGQYQVLSGSDLSVTKADGSVNDWTAKIEENGSLKLGYTSYTKAEPLALSTALLLGQWYDSTYYETNPSREFFDDGTYAIKSAIPELVADTILNYSVSGDNTFVSSSEYFPEGITRWAYLSKTETDYQLYWSQTTITLGESYTSLVFLSRPISAD